MVQDTFEDSRIGSNKQHQLVPWLRQSIYSRRAGYEDVNDAERLSVDPAMRHVVGGRAALTDKQAASTSEVGRRETEILSIGSNLKKPTDKSTRTRQRQSSTGGLAGRYFGGVSEPRNRGCRGENVKKSPHNRHGGARPVIIASLRAWICFRLNPNGKYRLTEH